MANREGGFVEWWCGGVVVEGGLSVGIAALGSRLNGVVVAARAQSSGVRVTVTCDVASVSGTTPNRWSSPRCSADEITGAENNSRLEPPPPSCGDLRALFHCDVIHLPAELKDMGIS